jgi:hypothetical protein
LDQSVALLKGIHAKAQVFALAPNRRQIFIHLTLTDEYPLAQAQVIIKAVAIVATVDVV